MLKYDCYSTIVNNQIIKVSGGKIIIKEKRLIKEQTDLIYMKIIIILNNKNLNEKKNESTLLKQTIKKLNFLHKTKEKK